MRAARVVCASWERSFVSTVREQVLSEFIDAWNAGKRPDVDDYVTRVPEGEQAELAEDLIGFLAFAPTPEYSDEALAAIRTEPIVAESLAASAQSGGLLPSLLTRLRERFGMSTGELAVQLVGELGLPEDRAPKTTGYLERLEQGRLEPARVSHRVFAALAKVFRVPTQELEGAADLARWTPAAPAAAPAFRAEPPAAAQAAFHLEVLADAIAAPGGDERDEVDDLFLGGR